MNIKDYRTLHKLTPEGAAAPMPKLLPPGVKARIKESAIDPTWDQFGYRGYAIYHSHHTDKWWVMSHDNMLVCWAVDKEDARNSIDFIIERERKK